MAELGIESCRRQELAPNNSMLRTALRAAADTGKRCVTPTCRCDGRLENVRPEVTDAAARASDEAPAEEQGRRGGEESEARGGSFVQLVPAASEREGLVGVIEVVLRSGHALRVRGSVDAELVAQLARTLSSC